MVLALKVHTHRFSGRLRGMPFPPGKFQWVETLITVLQFSNLFLTTTELSQCISHLYFSRSPGLNHKRASREQRSVLFPYGWHIVDAETFAE